LPGCGTPRKTAASLTASRPVTMVDMQPNQPAGSVPASRKVVLVTGASSGIGEAVAVRLVHEGHHVVAGARRTERLRTLAERTAEAASRSGGSLHFAQLDVTDRSSVDAFVEQARQQAGPVDVFVNNAGVMPLSRLDSLLVGEWNRMIDVNVRGLLHGIAAVLPHFTAQGAGHFVTVASIGAHQVVPTSAVYSGTKYAAWAITEGLRQESDPTIRVTTISPGVVTSELAESITEPGATEMMRTYRANAIEPAAIAGAVSYAIGQPADVDVNEIVVRPARQR
jgi:NADP-dependent 3-hydroxy acid dehydrogenase YdfG